MSAPSRAGGRRRHGPIALFAACGLLATFFTVGARAATGATDYYVSPQGSDSGDGSQSHPWATIQYAADHVQVGAAGATVHVADGTYTTPVRIETGGRAGAYLTFQAEHRWKATIAPAKADIVLENKASYVRIVGFEVTGRDAWAGILSWGRHNDISANHVHDIDVTGDCDGSPGGQGIGDDASASENTFIGNEVDTVGPYPRECEYIHNIYPSGAGDLVQNNISYHSSGSGIRFNHNAKGATIANNLAYANANHGIYITGGDTSADGFIITNNIAVDNAMYGIDVRSDANGAHNEYRNNLLHGNEKGAYGLDSSEEFTPPNTSGTVTGDPKLVDGRPAPGSPCVDGGVATGAPSEDYDGVPRPQGSAVDIGPYEFGGAAKSPSDKPLMP
jgi:hypothetical protein